ncbi:UDP-N-acetylmuramoyl-L-alanyl-D-glutamate--2,6-diaminopimelate ligase [bacterium]|nr:UDP-N-acetylmuramoyl-L-alanyl-D-glutamate--2,6-diaminopimelate ligase [bacterium]
MKTIDFVDFISKFTLGSPVTDKDRELVKITADSREVAPGSVFFCIKGLNSDGHDFIEAAFEKGAALVIGEKERDGKNYIRVNSVKEVLKAVLPVFYDEPDKKMKMIGVTGTNGKTSTTFILENMLQDDMCCGVIGTLNYKYAGKLIPAQNTTPLNWKWYSLLDDMRKSGVEAVISEVSSHALAENRIEKTMFDAAIFTNLTRDHLDFHKTFENYYQAKKKLFSEHLKSGGTAVINIDDEAGKRLSEELSGVRQIRISEKDKSAELFMKIDRISDCGSEVVFTFSGLSKKVKIPLVGNFNIYNTAGAFAAAALFIGAEKAFERIENNVSVPGRLEKVGKHAVYIDYAHTPDAMENVLVTLRKLGIYEKIIIVFGAGGDRDSGKRPIMGETACRFADKIIVTDDNPRTEDPEKIIADILAGCPEDADVTVINDRAEAIRKAVEIKGKNDVVLIAGKGAENYQITKSGKKFFSDRLEAEKSLGEE